jgi:hypothetical protein
MLRQFQIQSDFRLLKGPRKGLKRKSRKNAERSEELERKARFFGALAPKNAPGIF